MQSLTGRHRVIDFHTEEHQINRTDFRWIIRRLDRHGKRAGEARLDCKTVGTQRLQLGSACQKGDLLSDSGQQSTEVATRASSSDHRNTHLLSFSVTSIQRFNMMIHASFLRGTFDDHSDRLSSRGSSS